MDAASRWLGTGWIIHGGFDTAAGRAAADSLVATDAALTAIFAVNDFAAIGTLGIPGPAATPHRNGGWR